MPAFDYRKRQTNKEPAPPNNIATTSLQQIRQGPKTKQLWTVLNVVNNSGPILTVYCVRLLHAITCPFPKYFQIVCIFCPNFQIFYPFSTFLYPFSE